MKAIMEAYDDELIALGIAEGTAEGIMEKSKNVALQMLKNEEPLSKILLYSGLTLEKIQKLADEHGITPAAN